LKQGVIWTWPGFTSTSASKDTTSSFGTYTFRIHGVFGRDISQFSEYHFEKEVLFVPGTSMRVLQAGDSYCELQERMITLFILFIYLFIYLFVVCVVIIYLVLVLLQLLL